MRASRLSLLLTGVLVALGLGLSTAVNAQTVRTFVDTVTPQTLYNKTLFDPVISGLVVPQHPSYTEAELLALPCTATEKGQEAYVTDGVPLKWVCNGTAWIPQVDRTSVQTLINKTLTAPTVTGPTITGTVAGGATYTAPTITGPTVTGTVAGGATYTAPTITGPTVTGTVAGGATYTGPTLSAPVLSGTATGTYTLAGTPTITAPTIDIPKIQSYATASLPACTDRQLANVTDGIRGLWICRGTTWQSVTGYADVRDFGAVGDGVTNDRAAVQSAIDAVQAAGGGIVKFHGNPYLIASTPSPDSIANGLVVPYTADELNGGGTPARVTLLMSPQTRLLAGSNAMVVIRFSDSLGSVRGFPSIEANGHTGVWGLGLIPEDMTQTTEVVFQTYNTIEVVTRGTDEGVVLAGGPTVAGRDSGVWYNTIHHYHWGGKRGRWLKPATTAAAVVNNRNTFYGRVGGGANSGIYIQAGANNQDYSHYEGINTGTTPLATPTAIKVDLDTGVPGSDNADNEFHSYIEASTRWIDNASNSMKFFGPILDETKVLFAVRPVLMFTRRADGDLKTQLDVERYNGTLLVNTSQTAGSSSGDVVVPFQRGLRGVTNAGTNTIGLVRLTTNDWVEISPGGQVISLGGPVTRIKSSGTALVAGDIALSAGWGTTASVSAISGTDQRFEFTITSAGTGQGASPTFTPTFKDGTWGTAPYPTCVRTTGSQPTVGARVTNRTATTFTATWDGTPVATETYSFLCQVMG